MYIYVDVKDYVCSGCNLQKDVDEQLQRAAHYCPPFV